MTILQLPPTTLLPYAEAARKNFWLFEMNRAPLCIKRQAQKGEDVSRGKNRKNYTWPMETESSSLKGGGVLKEEAWRGGASRQERKGSAWADAHIQDETNFVS